MKHSLIDELVEIYTSREPAYVQARRRRFDDACAHCAVDTVGSIVASATLAAIFANTADPWVIAGWLLVVNGLSAARLVISILVPRLSARAYKRAQRIFFATLMLHGLVWVLPFGLFVPADSVAGRSIVLIWQAGIASWAVAAYTLIFEAVLGLLVLQFVPLALYLLFAGDRLWQLLSVACFIFVAAMAMLAIRNNALLMRGLITRFEKERLAEALDREKQAVLKLNANLELDLSRRAAIEIDLREEKARAEALAAELEKLSSLDGLTGIANRRRFDQTLEREWNRAARGHQPLALIMCDIDYFKQYNDRYGHQAGDACLRQLAQLLESALNRGGDLAARYGGEEFAILLPDTELANAALLADHIREQLQKLGIPHEASLIQPKLSASFGVAAMVPDSGTRPEILLRRADQALYAAKDQGRNRIVRADSADPEAVAHNSAHLH